MKIILRKPEMKDLPAFRKVFNDKELIKQISGIKYPLSLKEANKKLKEIIDKNKKGNHYEFAILLDDKFVGEIVLEKPSKDKKIFTLGYAIAREYWGKGIATIAVKKIIEFGFKDLKLKKIVADNDEDNPASAKVLEKNRFKFLKKSKKRNKNVLFWELNRK